MTLLDQMNDLTRRAKVALRALAKLTAGKETKRPAGGLVRTFGAGLCLLGCVGSLALEADEPSSPQLSVATNRFSIHLQSGFRLGREAIISVEGREVFRGSPTTSPILELAKMIPVTNCPANPMVVFEAPSVGITWSNRIDLAKGGALGISISTNSAVVVRQSSRFFYD